MNLQYHFYKAYANMERAAGKGELVILWRSSAKSRQYVAYRLKLSFNHEGVQKCQAGLIQKHEADYFFANACRCQELNLPEAVTLLRDAHTQNLRYGNTSAAELEQYGFILEYDPAGAGCAALTNKLIRPQMNLHSFVNIYLSAFRRMDTALLYDCSSEGRKKHLGPRADFLLHYGEEYAGLTFLRNSLAKIDIYRELYTVDAFYVVITPEEDIMKIRFRLIIREGAGGYCVERFNETGRELLSGDHPDNPFNYWIHCSVYSICNAPIIASWLGNEPGVLLTGETESFSVFKWLCDTVNPEQEFNISDNILAEYIVKNDELIIFAKKPGNLLQAEKRAAEYAPDCLKLQKKYYMPVNRIYKYIFAGCPEAPDDPCCLKQYEAHSALIYLADERPFRQYLNDSADEQAGLWPRSSYSYSNRREHHLPGFREYYLSKNWLKVYFYGEGAQLELERLQKRLSIGDMVTDQELANYFDLFNPAISEQRKWYIYGVLRRFYHEKNDLHKLKLVASFEDVLKVFGTIKTG